MSVLLWSGLLRKIKIIIAHKCNQTTGESSLKLVRNKQKTSILNFCNSMLVLTKRKINSIHPQKQNIIWFQLNI